MKSEDAEEQSPYPGIAEYGYIADCHSSALVSRFGSIDWCCMPRIDSGSCFGRILDWRRGGYCQIAPSKAYRSSRRYLEDTLILQTTFRTRGAEARLTDCFTMRPGGRYHPYRQILRVLEGLRGEMEFRVEIVPRLDYGAVSPWIKTARDNQHVVIGGSDGLLVCGDFRLKKHQHHLEGRCTVRKGSRIRLSILYRSPEELEDSRVENLEAVELDRRLEETIGWWKAWTSRNKISGPHARHVRRSALVLKGLSDAVTGAIAAAPTTSLPEAPGGYRNWDYRFTWVRDSSFALRSLAEVGHVKEADDFRRFVERSAAGSAEELQILFGVGGERRLHEFEIRELEGYRGATPVRIGNAAETQVQMDVYGELLELAWRSKAWGYSPDDDYWDFLVDLVNKAARSWRDPDRGIWEMRCQPRHFVHSKAMCWAALDRGIKLADRLGRKGPVEEWKKVRREIHRAVMEEGYDNRRGVFTQAFGRAEMDSALLLLPSIHFLDYKDERMIRTADAVREALEEYGLLRRYPPGNDEMEGQEGVFLPCSFWLAECLAYQGRLREAKRVFNRALGTGNDLGLFSEEYDTEAEEMLGNFPQGLTHLSLIAAAVALSRSAKKSPQKGRSRQ